MSGPWENYGSAEPNGPWQKYAPPPVGRSEGTAQAFGGGALFGFGDEATAGVRAAMPKLSNWMMRGPDLKRDESVGGNPTPQTVSDKPTFEGRYNDELTRERAKAATFRQSNPVLSAGAGIAGNVAGVAATLPAIGAAAPGLIARSASPIANVLKAGVVGGGYGGLMGYGEGEGEGRLPAALIGAGVGGALGGATVPLAAVGRSIAESPFGQYVGSKIVAPAMRAFSPSAPKTLSAAADGGTPPTGMNSLADRVANPQGEGALDRIATMAQRTGRSVESLKQELARRGPDAVLADLDEAFLRGARGVTVLPGQTSSRAESVLKGRDRQAGNRLVSAFEGSESPPTSYALRGEGQAFDQNKRAVGNAAYGDMAGTGLKQSPELMEIYQNPHVDAAINKVMAAEKSTRVGTDTPPASSVEIMHKVKQAIWDLGFDKETARPGPNASFYRNLGTQFVDRLKAANPALREADTAYRQAASLPEYFDTGRNFLARGGSEKATDVSGPALGDLLGKANPQQQAAARAGATNAARETALEGTRPARALAQRVDESSLVRDKLVQLYGSNHASAIMRQAENEGIFANTSNALLRGSKTAEKTADALDMGNAGLRIRPSGITPTLFEHLNAIRNWVVNPNASVRDAIGRTMLNQDQLANIQALERAGEILKARGNGNPLRLGVSGVGGGQGARE